MGIAFGVLSDRVAWQRTSIRSHISEVKRGDWLRSQRGRKQAQV